MDTPLAGYALGTSEPEIQVAFAGLVSPGDVVFDIGANSGFYAVIAAGKVGPDGMVVAFEPLPTNLELVRRNIAINQFPNVTALPYAVGDGDSHGTASFTLGFDATRGGLTAAHVEPGRNGTIDVEVRGLDELIASGEVPVPDVIKMDIEGAEVDALRGATRMLEEHRPALLIEIHDTGGELAGLLEAKGYACKLVESDAGLSESVWSDHVVATPRKRPSPRG